MNTVLGRAVCQAAVVALALPSFSFLLASRAEAQVQGAPTWAVVEFVDKSGKTPKIGAAAADAVQSELGKLQKYDLVPQETVSRTVTSLGLQSPVTDLTSLLRLGGELRAGTLITGEVVNWRVVNEGGGKRADVLMRVVVRDVASGLPVNGAALGASSSVRTGDADDMTLVNEALASGAAQAVRSIESKTLPTATVLNTLEREALINHGSRTGFSKGQEVIIIRGREQVATAVVSDLDPDSATVRVTRFIKGIQPGDRVRAIFQVPELENYFGAEGQIKTKRAPSSLGKRSDFGTILVVLGLAAVLLTQGRSSSNSATSAINSEATMFPDSSGFPAVKVSWRRDIFARGNSQVIQWQVYRNDVVGTPVLVIPGDQSVGIDDTTPRTFNYSDFGGMVGGNTCFQTSLPSTSGTADGVTPGRPYIYSVALVYRIAAIDLPDGGTTSTGGGGGTATATTGGTTTGGTTTGGTATATTGGTTTGGTATTTGGTATGGQTGGGTGGGAALCYFISPTRPAKGIATPLNRATLISPSSNAAVATDIPFTFTSVVNPAFPITVQYALQISPQPTFPGSQSKIYATVLRTDVGVLSTGNVANLINRLRTDFGSSTTEFFWRIGARNTADVPGPAPDPSGQRYVFSAANRFTIPAPPPPPPSE